MNTRAILVDNYSLSILTHTSGGFSLKSDSFSLNFVGLLSEYFTFYLELFSFLLCVDLLLHLVTFFFIPLDYLHKTLLILILDLSILLLCCLIFFRIFYL